MEKVLKTILAIILTIIFTPFCILGGIALGLIDAADMMCDIFCNIKGDQL